jgi:hypothetical protein
MEETNHCDNLKLNQLRADIQAGIASGDAGTLDADEIKRRARARHADALRDTEQRYETGQDNASIGTSRSRNFGKAAASDKEGAINSERNS